MKGLENQSSFFFPSRKDFSVENSLYSKKRRNKKRMSQNTSLSTSKSQSTILKLGNKSTQQFNMSQNQTLDWISKQILPPKKHHPLRTFTRNRPVRKSLMGYFNNMLWENEPDSNKSSSNFGENQKKAQSPLSVSVL